MYLWKNINNIFKLSTSKFGSYKDIPITKNDLQTAFVRSSGPGGQSVNKTSSKAQIRLVLKDFDWIDTHMKANIESKYSKYLNKNGQVIITSQIHRSQGLNLEECIKKLQKILYQCSLKPQQRKYQIPPQTEQMAKQRIQKKRVKSQIKSRRQGNKKFIDI